MSGFERLRGITEEDLGDAARDQGAPRIIRLHLVVAAQVALERVPLAFGDEAPNWLGELIGADARGLGRYLCDLELPVGPERRAAFRKSAIVSLGDPRSLPAGWFLPIEWRAASLAPLFPVFAGQLIIGADRIAVDGHYAPPFGVVGYVLDRALLSIAARGTARWFLGKVAGVIGPAGSARD
jgi:hypothetical protein